MSKPITIKDIAAELGISNTAVSAVLSPQPTRHVRVSEATRTRILEAAQQMRYRPNRAARALRQQNTNVIGIYTAGGYLNPWVAFTSQIIGGLQLGCDTHQKDLLLHGTYRDRTPEEIYDELVDGRVDGLVLYTSPQDPVAERLASSSLPVVAIVDALPGLPSVVVDDIGGSRLLAEHLVARGHRHLVYIAGDPWLTSSVRRQAAFEDAASAAGLQVDSFRPSAEHEKLAEADLAWLDLPRGQRPTAAVCWNDQTAYNLLAHCHRRGLRVPEDLAVTGFDGIPAVHAPLGQLTTIHAPWIEVAQTAIAVLMRRVAGEEIPMETALPVTLVCGETT